MLRHSKDDAPKARTPSPTYWRKHSWMAFRQRHRGIRPFRLLAMILAFVGAVHYLSSVSTYREQLAKKYSPTVYPGLSPEQQKLLANPRWRDAIESQDRHTTQETYNRQEVLDKWSEWTELGAGMEGQTFIFGNAVIKTFNDVRVPFRNCVPEVTPELRWPAEISASLLMGGLASSDAVDDEAQFLPVIDYFFAPSGDSDKPRWHLVTPLLRSGSLKQLSKKLHNSDTTYTAHDLDVMYRPSLKGLLEGLRGMHLDHDLCHDDVKPGNIFVAEAADNKTSNQNDAATTASTHWLLGDLGNARQTAHLYHSSTLWSGNGNNNLPDCQANDVYRLIKTYMLFLRNSVSDVAAFDRELLQGNMAWSRLFWRVRDSVERQEAPSAATVLAWSTSEDPVAADATREVSGRWDRLYRLFLGSEVVDAISVSWALQLRSAETVAYRRGLVPLLGMPSASCTAE